jgi:DNA-binding transcriptional regulator YiaG
MGTCKSRTVKSWTPLHSRWHAGLVHDLDLGELTRANHLCDGEGRAVRERAGVSLRMLAAVLGTNPGELSRWERSHSRPRPSSALRWLSEVEKMRGALTDATNPRPEPGVVSVLLTTSPVASVAAPAPKPGTARRGRSPTG